MEQNKYNYRTEEATKAKVQENKSEGKACPFCNGVVSVHDEICPHCGHKLVDYCTFCGTPMSWADEECPECGAPSGGIKCPDCGSLNYRAFCRKCNRPLTRAAERTLARAQAEPEFQKAQEVAKEVEQLEEVLETAPPQQKEEIKKKIKIRIQNVNDMLANMLPPAGSTPQEQRNYYAAHKIAVISTAKTRVKSGWVCNFCGCTHNQPSECTRPELGGKWLYTEETITVKDYKYDE